MIVVNPNGNGLTNGNLALATATAAQVLSGYTFYAGDKELKTGTLVPTPKIATGSFGELADNESLTINCGFRPIAVMIHRGNNDSNRFLVANCYEESTYLVAQPSSYANLVTWEGTSDITFSSTGFTVRNSTNGTGTFPFTQLMYREYFYYIAIG